MQNLTAHYNILFNAKELLRLKQESYAVSFIDNYNEILSVYQDTIAKTGNPDKDLDAAMEKANKIINVKEQSHYLGDAYLILGQANYLGGNYFNAGVFWIRGALVSRQARSEAGSADLEGTYIDVP